MKWAIKSPGSSRPRSRTGSRGRACSRDRTGSSLTWPCRSGVGEEEEVGHGPGAQTRTHRNIPLTVRPDVPCESSLLGPQSMWFPASPSLPLQQAAVQLTAQGWTLLCVQGSFRCALDTLGKLPRSGGSGSTGRRRWEGGVGELGWEQPLEPAVDGTRSVCRSPCVAWY